MSRSYNNITKYLTDINYTLVQTKEEYISTRVDRNSIFTGVVKIGSFNMLGFEMPFRGVQFYDPNEESKRQEILKAMDEAHKPYKDFNEDWSTNASAYERPYMVPRFSICCNLTSDKLDLMTSIVVINDDQERAAAFEVNWDIQTSSLPDDNMEAGKTYDRSGAMNFDRIMFETLRAVIIQQLTDNEVPALSPLFDGWNNMSIPDRFKLAYWTLWGLDSTGRGVANSDDEDTNKNKIAQMKLDYILDTMHKRNIDVMLIQENGLSGIFQITRSGYDLHFSTNRDFAYITKEGWTVQDTQNCHKNFEHVRIIFGNDLNIVIDAVNVHLPSSKEKRELVFPLLQNLVNTLSEQHLHVVIAGDFNCDLTKVTYKNSNDAGNVTNADAGNTVLKMVYARPDEDVEEKFSEAPFTCNKMRTHYQPQKRKAGIPDCSVKDYVMRTISEATETNTYVETLSEFSDHSLIYRQIEIFE